MPQLSLNREQQKKVNRGLVLMLVAVKKCTSRIELSKATGLTKTAISHIVNELIEKDYLIETGKKASPEPGRNQIELRISPRAPRFAGILVQRGSCQAVLCDMELTILREKTICREFQNREELLDTVYELLDDILSGEKNVAGIGAASIGSVDARKGIILHPLYFHGIKNVELRRMLEERYHLPVAFDHDNQSAALAEHLYGNGRGYDDILLVSLGRGVGCGVLVDGRRIHSYTGYPPEIGHISIDYNGNQCICGNRGCLETYINTEVFLKQCREATGISRTYEEYCQMTDRPQIDAIMRDTVEKLSSGILSTLNILNSQLVLLCMDCCYWPEKYIRMVEENINQKKFGNCELTVPVRKAYFMHKTQVLGAACNIINEVFQGNLL